MFFGTIHDDIRRYIAGNAHSFDGKRIVVGCSGNFTSEKVLRAACKPSEIHSNDVSLYSKLLADAMLNNAQTELVIAESEYEWLAPFLESDDPWSRPATVMLMMRLLKYEKRKTAHARRMWRNYELAFDGLVTETARQLEERAIGITSYYSGDVFAHFEEHDWPDGVFMAYLPFFKGDYESQYRRVEQIIQWDEPHYQLLDQDRKSEIVGWMMESDRSYLFLLDYPLDGIEPQVISHKGRNTWVYVYSNVVAQTGLFRPKYKDTGVRFKLLPYDYQFTPDSRVGLAKIKSNDIQYYKGVFLARNIDYTAGEQGFAVLVDDRVVGFIEMSRGKHPPYNMWYMLSDFPIEPLVHPRISKLIVMVALTKEMKTLLERTNYRYTTGVVTTARTERPVSMKYRGPMKLLKRGVDELGGGYLNYGADWSGKTVAEVYRTWHKRYIKS